MPADVQSNGLLSQLVGLKAQKEAQQKTDQIGIWKSIVSDPQYTDSQREMAAGNLKALAGDVLGGGGSAGGGKGKSGGGGTGGKSGAGGAGSPGDFFTQLFHKAVDHLHKGGGQGQGQAQGQQRQGQQQQPQTPAASGRLTLTQADRDRIQLAAQKAIDDEKVRMDTAIQEGKNKADEESAVRSATGLREVYGRDLEELGYKKGTPEFNEALAQKLGYQVKGNASEKVYLKGPDGKTIIARRDPKTQDVYNIAGRKLDSSQYTEVDKDPAQSQDVTPLRSHEERLRIEHPDWPDAQVKLEAAKAVDKDEATKAKQGETRLNIQVQNAANQNTPIAPDSLKTLAEEWVDSGGTISIPLSYRGPQRAKLADAIAKTIEDRKAAGNDTTLIEQRYKNQQLQELTKLKPQIDAGVAATTKEIDRAKFLARAVPATSFRKFNNLMQLINSEVTDDPDLAAFREALVAARSRYNAMITNMRSGGGTATNQIRTETLDEVLSRQMAPAALQRALDEMKIGIGNVKSGYEDTIKQYREQRTGGTGSTGGVQPIALKDGTFLTPHDQAAADKFRKDHPELIK